jgi:hypothetical protein
MEIKKILIYTAISIFVIGGAAWTFPTYKVWKKEMDGKARLREAE